MKLNSSFKMNKNFANEVSRMSIEKGIEIHVARNIMRFNRNLKNVRHQSPVWTDPKTGLALSQAQWESPSQRRARMVVAGTGTNRSIENAYYIPEYFEVSQDPQSTYTDAERQGMVKYGSVLLSNEQVALLQKYHDAAAKNPAMQSDDTYGLEN